MRLRAIVPLLSSCPLLFACPSSQSICRSGVDQVCERVHECQPFEVQSTAQFQAVFGTDVEDCKTKLYVNPLAPQGVTGIACDDVDTDQKLCANLGQPAATDFDLGQARDCRDTRNRLSCSDYLGQLQDPSLAPTSCAQRCK